MNKNNKITRILGVVLSIPIVVSIVGCTNKNQDMKDSKNAIENNLTSEGNTQSQKSRTEMPDFENMTEEEKAEFEKNRPEKPDFENMNEEEKAEFEKNRPEKSN